MAVPRLIIMTPLNDQVINITGLKDKVSGDFQNAATVTAELQDQFGVVVPGSSITLNYVTGSNGNYQGQVEEQFEPPIGGGYTLVFDGVEGVLVMHMEIPTEVQARKS